MLRLRSIPIALLGCALLIGCSDDNDEPAKNNSSAGSAGKSSSDNQAGETSQPVSGGGNGAGGEGTGSAQPLYVVSTGVISGDDFIGYLAPISSIEGGGTFDLGNAVEIGGGAWVFNRPGDSSIYVASLFDPTIARWTVSTKGKLQKEETLSFANLGVASAYLAAAAPIFSEEKSYFADEDQDQIVIWNPKKMELIDTIALGDDVDGNLIPIPEGTILVHDDKLIITVGWRDADDTSVYGDHVRVLTIDTKTDEIIDSHDEDRNVHAAFNAQESKGTAYYSPYSLYTAYTEIGDGHGAPSLALRILPGERNFDPDYLLDLSKLVGGRPAGDYTLLDDETALIRAWHPEIVDEVDPEDWQSVLWNQAGFKWWRWHVGDDQAVEIENQEPGAQGATIFKLDGKTFTTRYADDLSSTDVIEITPEGEFVSAFTAPGAIVGGGVLRIH